MRFVDSPHVINTRFGQHAGARCDHTLCTPVQAYSAVESIDGRAVEAVPAVFVAVAHGGAKVGGVPAAVAIAAAA